MGNASANFRGSGAIRRAKPDGSGALYCDQTAADGISPQSMQSKYLPLKSEQIEQGIDSDRAAFAFDFATLGCSPNRNRQGATLLALRGQSKRAIGPAWQLHGVEFFPCKTLSTAPTQVS